MSDAPPPTKEQLQANLKKIEERYKSFQQQLRTAESWYVDACASGNLIRGFDNNIFLGADINGNSTQASSKSRSERAAATSTHIFTDSSAISSLDESMNDDYDNGVYQ